MPAPDHLQREGGAVNSTLLTLPRRILSDVPQTNFPENKNAAAGGGTTKGSMTEIEKFVNAGMAAQAAVDEHGPTAYIVGLVREFPCLNRKLGPLWHPKKFDADHFHGMIGRWSHGEQLCALFVLNVWNPSYAQEKGWTFDLFDFAGIADAGNKQPVMSWLQSPYWP